MPPNFRQIIKTHQWLTIPQPATTPSVLNWPRYEFSNFFLRLTLRRQADEFRTKRRRLPVEGDVPRHLQWSVSRVVHKQNVTGPTKISTFAPPSGRTLTPMTRTFRWGLETMCLTIPLSNISCVERFARYRPPTKNRYFDRGAP
jgi:hypothetical protein